MGAATRLNDSLKVFCWGDKIPATNPREIFVPGNAKEKGPRLIS